MQAMKHLVFAIAFLFLGVGGAGAGDSAKQVTLYKTPQCGCCEGYADHLRDSGFKVTVKATDRLGAISSKAGIAPNLQGCHTMFVDGYVVSGHVPINIVQRMLAQRPAIKGISLPGMPVGSPGMPGPKEEPFTIYEIKDGPPKVYMVD